MGPTLDVRGACGLATIGNSTFVSCVQTIVSGRFSVLSCRAFTNIISYTEALNFLSGTLVFTITDLETLERLSQMKRNIDATSLKSVSPVLHSRVTKLNIIMRWPLELYQSYETHATDSADLSTELLATKKSWRRLAETIERFDSLLSLHLWFDHSAPCSWSMVDERALLSPLLTALSPTSIDICISLPKLHPVHGREHRHFVNGHEHMGPRAQLHRTLRQRWHPQQNSRLGRVEVLHRPDFPFSIDAFEDFTIDQAEQWERKMWSEGVDVEAVIKDLIEPRHEYLAI